MRNIIGNLYYLNESVYKEGITMIHCTYKDLLNVLNSMYAECVLDSVEVVIRCPHTACESYLNGLPKNALNKTACATFELRTLNGITKKWVHLWQSLEKHGISDIIFKSNMKGYLIDSSNNIYDSWDLDDSMT